MLSLKLNGDPKAKCKTKGHGELFVQSNDNWRKNLNFSSADYRIIRNGPVKFTVPAEYAVNIHDNSQIKM